MDEKGAAITPPAGYNTRLYSLFTEDVLCKPAEFEWYEYRSHKLNKTMAATEVVSANNNGITLRMGRDEKGVLQLNYMAKAKTYFDYKDDHGNNIASIFENAPTEISGYRGQVKDFVKPEKAWYRFDGLETVTKNGEPVSATLNPDNTVTLGFKDATTTYLRYTAQAEVKVRYVDEKGNDLSPIIGDAVPYIISGDRDSVHDIAAPEIYSFEYAGMDISTPDGRMHSATLDAANKKITLNHEDASTVTVRYQGKASVKIRYIDDEFNDVNAIFKELEPDNIEFLKAGNRDDAFSVYCAEEIGDYSYDHMEIRLNGEYPLPEGKIIPPDALTSISATFDTNTGDGVLRLYDNAEITVVYNYRGTVWMRYQDEYGNDLVPRCDPTPPEFIEGYHKRTKEIPTPELDFFEFQRYELATREGERPSGYIDGPKDNTVTFGVRDASTITDRYRGWGIVKFRYVDEYGNDISAEFGAEAIPSLKGYRDTEIGIPTPKHRFFEFQRYTAKTEPGAEWESGRIENGGRVTFNLGDKTTVTVHYRGCAETKVKYVDEDGNDISNLFDVTPAPYLRAFRDEEIDIPTSELPFYEFSHYTLSTTAGSEPSGYIDDRLDSTVTMGLRDASHIVVHYRALVNVPVRYVDTGGRDLYLDGVMPRGTIAVIKGYRYEKFEFKVPALVNFTFVSAVLSSSDETVFMVNRETATYHDLDCTERGEAADCEVMAGADVKAAGLKKCRSCRPVLLSPPYAEPSVTHFIPASGNTMLYTGRFLKGNGSRITVVYQPNPFAVELVDPSDSGLADGVFEVVSSDGKTVYSGTTDESGRATMAAVSAGQYKLKQVSAPAGYYLNPELLDVAVDKYNKVSGWLKQTDQKIIKTVICRDTATNAVIPNVKVGLFENGKLVSEAVTGSDGKASFWLQRHADYTIKQISAPTPYILSNDVVTMKITEKTIDDGKNEFVLYNSVPVPTGGEPLPTAAIVSAITAVILSVLGVWLVRRRIFGTTNKA